MHLPRRPVELVTTVLTSLCDDRMTRSWFLLKTESVYSAGDLDLLPDSFYPLVLKAPFPLGTHQLDSTLTWTIFPGLVALTAP